MEESLYYLVHESPLRVVLFEGLQGNGPQRLRDMRPSPSYNLVFAKTQPMNSIYKTVSILLQNNIILSFYIIK